ncbi:hypothetical protein HYT23_01215 [Candidatus Pacearchaeota archaeon]|nr:hypothetical protein [Candidatus Pacearchaeota archaeon]
MKGITFSSDNGKIGMKDHLDSAKMMEEYFKTSENPEEAQINMKNIKWVHENVLDFDNIIKFEGKIIGNTFMLPCTKDLMGRFLSNSINENQLFEEIKKNVNPKKFDAIYLCSSFIKPEFRGKGLSVEARMKTIKRVTKNLKIKPILFYEPYTEEGEKSCEKVAEILGLELRKRETLK